MPPDQAPPQIDPGPREGSTTEQEVLRPPRSLEAHDVGTQQPPQQLFPDRLGEDSELVRSGEGDVGEMGDRCVGPAAPKDRRHQRQVVVLDQEDGRRTRRRPLFVEGSGELLVHRAIGRPIQSQSFKGGATGEVPQVVVEEPQHTVGDPVVEAPVLLWVEGQHPEAIALAVGVDVDRSSRVAVIRVGHRRGDPQAAGGLERCSDRGDQPALASPGNELPPFVFGERDGPPVRRDDDAARSGRRGHSAASILT